MKRNTARGPFHRLHKRIWNLSRFLRKTLWFMLRTGAPWPLVARNFVDGFAREAIEREHFDAKAAFVAKTETLDFSGRWFVDHVPMWLSVARETGLDRRDGIEALEIGSWEGMSSLFLLDTLPGARLTCVDTWGGGDEHHDAEHGVVAEMSRVEARFDANNAAHAGRIVKFKGYSRDYFAAHRDEERFDFIYVDGSHFADDVVHDAFDAFAALKVGGVMIFDDYLWRYYSDPLDNPASAVNALVRIKAGSCRILRAYQQVVLVKTGKGRSEPRG